MTHAFDFSLTRVAAFMRSYLPGLKLAEDMIALGLTRDGELVAGERLRVAAVEAQRQAEIVPADGKVRLQAHGALVALERRGQAVLEL